MTALIEENLSKIMAHQLPGLPSGADLVMPYDEGLSLVNVPCSITRLLSVPDFGNQPLDHSILDALGGPYKKVILLLVDALGYDLFESILHPSQQMVWGKYLDRAVYTPITSICPSTTASALTTLWTGEPAGIHGIIGYEMWSKEYGMVMNNILHTAASARRDVGGLSRSGFEPQEFMRTPVLGTHLLEHGVKTTAYMHSSIANSGLSNMQLTDVDVDPYVDEADLWVSLAAHLNTQLDMQEYIYVYYSHVDTLMHRFSAQDPRILFQFDAFSSIFEKAFLNGLSEKARQDTLLILTADHGSMTTPKDKRYELRYHPALLDNLVMQPTCENRLAFLYVTPGKKQTVRDYIEQTWPGAFYVVESDDTLKSGLFGESPYHEDVAQRLGDLIVIARGDAYLWWAPKPNPMAGRHGGLSQSEMLVPFYALPLGKI
jgi:predicted AlkP superfamily pyrophosphatase or phosphodiesterase